MELGWLSDVAQHDGQVASVHVDVTRNDPQGEHTQDLHRQAVVSRLRELGAPQQVVDVVDERAGAPTGESGEQGRHLVVAEDGEVLLDLLVPQRPTQDEASWGLVPSLLPLLRPLDAAVAHLVVEADKSGADIQVVDSLGRLVRSEDVEGGHELLHKVRGGGWSHRRMQSRVEDSWERNADAVLAELARLDQRHHPEVVLLTGDPHACGLVRDGAGSPLADKIRWVRAGGRAEGVDREAMAAELEEVLNEVRRTRMATTVADFGRAEGQGTLSAAGLPAVVTAAQRASVQTLLLADGPREDGTLWTAADPLLLGTSEQEVRDLGGEPVEAPALDVLVRSVAAQDGGLELVEGVEGVLPQGVGALLRFDVRPSVPGG